MAGSVAPHLTTALFRYGIGVHAVVCPTTPPSTSCALRMNAITRPCSFSYFWSSRRISANNNLSLTAVRGYFWVSFLQLNHVWVRFLGIFLPNRYQHAAVWCNLSIIASDLPGMRHSTFMYTCSRRVRPIYSYRPTNSGARRLAVLLLC